MGTSNNAIYFNDENGEKRFDVFIPVDKWIPMPFRMTDDILNQDTIFQNSKGYIIAPITSIITKTPQENLGMSLDNFAMSPKKCYNSQVMRDHTCHYLNYFTRFYDSDKEYLCMLANMKWTIDTFPEYNKAAFIDDIKRYILSQSIVSKVIAMTEANYSMNLTYKNVANPSLQYTDEHAKMLMEMSVLMNMIIPLLTHFAKKRKILSIDEFLLEAFDHILYMFDANVDMFSKLMETSITNVGKNEKGNQGIWAKQDIRGRNVTTHSEASVNNIILNIMPKYVFDQNIVSLNYASISNNTGFQITDIEFEFSYIPLSSSKRDEDNNSEFDKFESTLVKQSVSKYLQVKINSHFTMNVIEDTYGPFDEEEIQFYRNHLKGENCINEFQKHFVFNLFYKYFGDAVSINAINKDDYIKLTIAAKKMLLSNGRGMILLPYIISGRAEKIVGRKSVNKKEMIDLQKSYLYSMVEDKYRNGKIIKLILSDIASLVSSDFYIIDYQNPELNGQRIEIIPSIIMDEMLSYVLMI